MGGVAGAGMNDLLRQLMALHVAVVGMTMDDDEVMVRFRPAQIVRVEDVTFSLRGTDGVKSTYTIEKVKALSVRPRDE